jgi:organic radical activating enzyme
MTSIQESIKRWFSPVKPLSPGIYHFQAPPHDPRNYRLHLRLEKDGTGVLIINASTVLHLNQTAAEYAYHLVLGKSEEEVAGAISSRYRISFDQARQDFADFLERIDTLVTIPDLDPVTDLEFSRQKPYTGPILAPYRLDCALTYRLPPNASPESAPLQRVKSELATIEWKQIFDKAWAQGIPHIIFTGGEPTLREDLNELIQHAEKNGQVTGLMTDGHRFGDGRYFSELLQTGLDHLLLLPALEFSSTWKILEMVSKADIFTTVHITLTKENKDNIPEYLSRLADIGLKSLSLSARGSELNEQLLAAREQGADLGLSLVWDLPVPYSSQNPFQLEFTDRERPSGIGKAWLYIEPDGDVLPDQSINQVLGNFLHDPWDKIWHPEDSPH